MLQIFWDILTYNMHDNYDSKNKKIRQVIDLLILSLLHLSIL